MTFKLEISEIQKIRATAKERSFIVSDEFLSLSDSQMQRICNGIGPDKFPGILHEIADDVLARFVAASGPHDVRYEYAAGNTEDWHAANLEFLQNCIKSIPNELGVCKMIEVEVAHSLYYAVESVAGWESYMAAFKRGPTIPKSEIVKVTK